MKLVVVVALIAGCGGSATPEPAKPGPVEPKPATDSGMAVQAGGFNDEGVKAMYAGNYSLASEHFRAAIARVPEAKYFFNLCTSLFQEGKFGDAKVACAAVDTNNPTRELAEKAHKLDAKIDAEAKGPNVVMPTGDVPPDATPTTGTGGQATIAAKLSDEGVTLMYAKKYAEATAKFREAVARVPEPKYFFNLCTSLFQEGKFSEALTSCDAVAKNNPTPTLQTKANKLMDKIRDEAKAQGIVLRP